MNDLLKACKSYLECEFRETRPETDEASRPFVTISRQAGAGGITIGRLLGKYLREHDKNAKCSCPWTVFDKDLILEALKNHNLPEGLAEYMTEDKI